MPRQLKIRYLQQIVVLAALAAVVFGCGRRGALPPSQPLPAPTRPVLPTSSASIADQQVRIHFDELRAAIGSREWGAECASQMPEFILAEAQWRQCDAQTLKDSAGHEWIVIASGDALAMRIYVNRWRKRLTSAVVMAPDLRRPIGYGGFVSATTDTGIGYFNSATDFTTRAAFGAPVTRSYIAYDGLRFYGDAVSVENAQ